MYKKLEEQYLRISKEQSKKLNKKGFSTYAETSISDGQKKIIGYLINLSDILNHLETQSDLIEKIKLKHDKIKNLDKSLSQLKSKITEKEKDLEALDINKKIAEIVEQKLKELKEAPAPKVAEESMK